MTTSQPVKPARSFVAGFLTGSVLVFVLLSVLFSSGAAYYLLVVESTPSEPVLQNSDSHTPTPSLGERTTYSVTYDIGYDDGYYDGVGEDTEYAQNYFVYADSETAQAYHDGYLDGYFDGCDDGDWDCTYLSDALAAGYTGIPGNDVLHTYVYDQVPFDLPSQDGQAFATSSDLYDARSAAIVAIYDGYTGFVGSGVILTANGLVVTNHHVMNGLEDPYVQSVDGTTYEIRALEAVDEYRDLALFWVAGENLPFVPMQRSQNVRIGADVVVIGNPEGYINTISTGELSGRREEDGLDYLQTTAPITYGSSGGALLDLATGHLIGIITSGYDLGNLNFAVPSEDIYAILGF